MIRHLIGVLACAFVALISSAIAMAIAYALISPQLLQDQARLWALVWAYFPRFTGIPTILLVALVLLRRPATLLVSGAICGLWVIGFFAWWGYGPFLDKLDISWVGYWKHFAGMFAAGLTLGIVFSACLRAWLGPNNSFKPTPLRGAA